MASGIPATSPLCEQVCNHGGCELGPVFDRFLRVETDRGDTIGSVVCGLNVTLDEVTVQGLIPLAELSND